MNVYIGTSGELKNAYIGEYHESDLLSYQDMVDLGNNGIYEALDELNAHPLEYYNKYSQDGHLYEDSGFTGLGITDEGFYVFYNQGVMPYDDAMDLFREHRILVYDGTEWYYEIVGTDIPPDFN